MQKESTTLAVQKSARFREPVGNRLEKRDNSSKLELKSCECACKSRAVGFN